MTGLFDKRQKATQGIGLMNDLPPGDPCPRIEVETGVIWNFDSKALFQELVHQLILGINFSLMDSAEGDLSTILFSSFGSSFRSYNSHESFS